MTLRNHVEKPSDRLDGSPNRMVIAMRPPLRDMSDTELLRFGTVAKYMCSEKSALDEKQREAFSLQLHDARKEWARRFPSLPLSSTFEEDPQPASAANCGAPVTANCFSFPSDKNR